MSLVRKDKTGSSLKRTRLCVRPLFHNYALCKQQAVGRRKGVFKIFSSMQGEAVQMATCQKCFMIKKIQV